MLWNCLPVIIEIFCIIIFDMALAGSVIRLCKIMGHFVQGVRDTHHRNLYSQHRIIWELH